MVQQVLNYVRQKHNAGSYKIPSPSKPQSRGPKSQRFKRKKYPAEPATIVDQAFQDHLPASWWIDFGATRHIAKDKSGVTEFTELKKGEQRIYKRNNTYLDVEGISSYRLDLGDNILVLKDVFYAPGIRRNLISVPSLMKKGLEVKFYNNRVSIGKNNKVV
ncbi:uncharacterized protein LOC109840129 [Asparagus officinalis]|uniref:uncharacterized protein LOC109840129 n=1 Tax=Asparagus officinalis TaxID=4686 RepID=UPI00098DF58C|nr:uncharacterized protein LOC109840129 [Asparagus officinalis]